MKKTITLFLASFGVIISNAQITLTSADFFGVGKILYEVNDTVTPLTIGAINPGPAGANKTWNFSNLQISTVDTMTATNPAWLPNGSKFPGANLAMLFNDGSAYYLKSNSTGVDIIGAEAGGGPFGMVLFNPTEKFETFPDTYNSTFQNTSKFSVKDSFTQFTGADSIKVEETKVKNVKTDGWGTVTTPLGTYSCLRQRGQVTTTDSIFVHIAVFNQWTYVTGNTSSSYHFAWWANGVGLPLLEFDSLNNDTISAVTWLKAIPAAGAVHENAAFKGLNTYPNPSTGKINISLPGTVSAATAEVYTAEGEKIGTSTLNGGKESSIDLSKQANGVYYLQIKSKEGVITRKIVVSK